MAQSKKVARVLAIWAMLQAILGIVVTIIYFVETAKVNDVQGIYQDECDSGVYYYICQYRYSDITYYDIGFYVTPLDDWTDLKQALTYIDDLEGESEEDACDQDCQEAGCRWSKIFLFNGITVLFLVVIHVGFQIGIHFKYQFRLLGWILFSLISAVHLAAIVTTGVFRFNTMGKLAALSLQPTNPQDDDSQTYSAAATLITWLWSLQIILFISHCVHFVLQMKTTQ